MKRVKHFLLASCLFPTLLGAQEMASAYFLELTPDAQSAGMAGTGLATTDNGSTAIFHNASTIAFSQEVIHTLRSTKIMRYIAPPFSTGSEGKAYMDLL